MENISLHVLQYFTVYHIINNMCLQLNPIIYEFSQWLYLLIAYTTGLCLNLSVTGIVIKSFQVWSSYPFFQSILVSNVPICSLWDCFDIFFIRSTHRSSLRSCNVFNLRSMVVYDPTNFQDKLSAGPVSVSFQYRYAVSALCSLNWHVH